MPTPPPTSAFTRYLLENPWPGALVLGFVGAILLWRGLSDGRRGLVLAGAIAVVAAMLNVGVAALITTAGEHARRTVREFVEAAVAGNAAEASARLTDDVTINFERPENPSMDRTLIDRGLDAVATRHRVESNSVTMLKGFTVNGDTGVVHLGCWTQTATSMGSIPSQWVMRVKRGADGSWRITRMTCVSIAGRPPTPW